MKIEERLPFSFCRNCSEFVLDVEEQQLFAYDSNVERVIVVSCRNENLCKRLKEKVGQDADEA